MSRSRSAHIAILRRRRDHLAERVKEERSGNSYDRAELAALNWALAHLAPASPAPNSGG